MAHSWLCLEKICKARIRVASSMAVYWYRFTAFPALPINRVRRRNIRDTSRVLLRDTIPQFYPTNLSGRRCEQMLCPPLRQCPPLDDGTGIEDLGGASEKHVRRGEIPQRLMIALPIVVFDKPGNGLL